MLKKLLSTFLLLILISHSGYSQKLAQSFKVTYDESFRPKLTVKLLNKLNKQVSHVVYQFQFADTSAWQDDSVSRSLAAQSTTTITRLINLKPGYNTTDSFLIPIPDKDSGNEPQVKILMVRYEDGTIDKSFSQ
jgi:hypothetical protein